MRSINIRISVGVVCVLALLMSYGCGVKKGSTVQEIPKIPVQVMKVVAGDIEDIIEYAGNIRAEEEATVYPKVSGKIIEKLKQEGDRVAKGQVVAYIDRDEVGLKFERAPVVSPIEGLVGNIYVDVGTSVNNQTPVAFIVSLERVKVNVYIPEKYLSRIYTGQAVAVFSDAYPGKQFSGSIARISPILNQESRSFMVEITVSNASGELKSGMFVRTHILLEKKHGVPVILKEAVQGRGADTYVFLAQNGKASMRKVELGLRSGAYYEVKRGLQTGDLVVVMGQQKLREGSDILVEERK